jgi:hypothetical protein
LTGWIIVAVVVILIVGGSSRGERYRIVTRLGNKYIEKEDGPVGCLGVIGRIIGVGIIVLIIAWVVMQLHHKHG